MRTTLARAMELTKQGKLLNLVPEDQKEGQQEEKEHIPPPTLDASKLLCTFYNAKGDLPVRQEWLDMIEQKLLDPTSVLKFSVKTA